MKVNANGIEINCVVEGNGPWLTMSNSLTCNLFPRTISTFKAEIRHRDRLLTLGHF